jgi:hypothetical protein
VRRENRRRVLRCPARVKVSSDLKIGGLRECVCAGNPASLQILGKLWSGCKLHYQTALEVELTGARTVIGLVDWLVLKWTRTTSPSPSIGTLARPLVQAISRRTFPPRKGSLHNCRGAIPDFHITLRLGKYLVSLSRRWLRCLKDEQNAFHHATIQLHPSLYAHLPRPVHRSHSFCSTPPRLLSLPCLQPGT